LGAVVSLRGEAVRLQALKIEAGTHIKTSCSKQNIVNSENIEI
jgi:hypothetical protein